MASADHLTAATAEDPSQPGIDEKRRAMSQEERDSYKAVLKNVYWLVTEEIANVKYASLLELCRQLGVPEIIKLRRGGNSTKESNHVFYEMLTALCDVRLRCNSAFNCNLKFLYKWS